MKIAPSMKMIMNLCKQDRLDAWGSLRVAFTQFPLSKNKKICVFESDILHILLADSIISTAKRFREMKKFQFLKAGDYMKTITRAKYLDRIIELNGTPDIKIIFIDFMDLVYEKNQGITFLTRLCVRTLSGRQNELYKGVFLKTYKNYITQGMNDFFSIKLEFVITFHTYWHSLQSLYLLFLIVPQKLLLTQVQHALFYIHNHLIFVLLYVYRWQ